MQRSLSLPYVCVTLHVKLATFILAPAFVRPIPALAVYRRRMTGRNLEGINQCDDQGRVL